MKAEWTCRHCEHWRHETAGNYGNTTQCAPTCAMGEDPFWVLSPADCPRYTREPGADDELETPPEATGADVRRLRS